MHIFKLLFLILESQLLISGQILLLSVCVSSDFLPNSATGASIKSKLELKSICVCKHRMFSTCVSHWSCLHSVHTKQCNHGSTPQKGHVRSSQTRIDEQQGALKRQCNHERRAADHFLVLIEQNVLKEPSLCYR